MADICNVLMVFPRFNPKSFWSYEGVREVLGARYPLPPLGMITVAAMLPGSWTVRLVNRNAEELGPSDLDWADMVMTGGMLSQQFDTLKVIRLAQDAGKPVVIGGPDVTSSPHIYAGADIQVLGEAESVIDDFVAAWERGERQGVFEAPKFQADVTKTPIPRFDLLKLHHYLYVGLQFSRGCPFLCEFCDIIELYGRSPRTKTSAQMLAELDALYAIGYRGQVDFVDDNLIGNKKAVKAFLPDLIAWQKKRKYPFMLTTEASLNLADDEPLMQLMRAANFIGLFVGIESPEEETLIQMQKKQNTRRSIPESVHRINSAGLIVTAGFVLGFDSEKDGVAEAILQCIEESTIPVVNISLLYALAGTQLTRRLEREGRLRSGFEADPVGRSGDFVVTGLNFATARPHRVILQDYVTVVSALYRPAAFFRRVRRMLRAIDHAGLAWNTTVHDARRQFSRFFRLMFHVTRHRPDMRGHSWRLLGECLIHNPRAIGAAVAMIVFYVSLGPLSRHLVAEVQARLDALDEADQAAPASPALLAPAAAA
jgi:radical SAM superfamily enzyme YgiQ (UPF0313 family)